MLTRALSRTPNPHQFPSYNSTQLDPQLEKYQKHAHKGCDLMKGFPTVAECHLTQLIGHRRIFTYPELCTVTVTT